MNSANLKVLHIIDSGGLYGAEIMLLNLVDEQVKLGLTPIIASIGEKNIDEKPIETEAVNRGIPVERFRMMPGPNVMGVIRILKFAHVGMFDILHSHGYKGNILLGFIPQRIRKIPMLSTLHGYTNVAGFSKMKVYEYLDLLSHQFIDQIILVNKGMLEHPRLKNRNHVNYQIINNGISIPVPDSLSTTQSFNSGTDTAAQEVIDFCKKGFTVGSIGRLSSEKGYGYLIDSVALLREKEIDARLVIIGDGDDRDYLERCVAKYELQDRIIMPGYIENARKYIPFFNVYVISSITEGLPITLLEAMQSNVPIVATGVGGIPDVLEGGKAGLIVQPFRADELAEAIIKVHREQTMVNELTIHAAQRVKRYYTTEIMALGYLNVYKSLIEKEYHI